MDIRHGISGEMALVAVCDLFKNTEFAIVRAIVTPKTWAQVVNLTAEAINSGSTVTWATEID